MAVKRVDDAGIRVDLDAVAGDSNAFAVLYNEALSHEKAPLAAAVVASLISLVATLQTENQARKAEIEMLRAEVQRLKDREAER